VKSQIAKKNNNIQIRLDDGMRDALDVLAAVFGDKLSGYVRHVLKGIIADNVDNLEGYASSVLSEYGGTVERDFNRQVRTIAAQHKQRELQRFGLSGEEDAPPAASISELKEELRETKDMLRSALNSLGDQRNGLQLTRAEREVLQQLMEERGIASTDPDLEFGADYIDKRDLSYGRKNPKK